MKRSVKIGFGLVVALAVAAVAVMVSRSGRDVEIGRDKVVRVPAGIDHSEYDRLLKKYVDDRGLVAYADWRGSEEDMQALKNYLAQYALATDKLAEGNDLAASLINAYNAFAMEMVLDEYPIDSIMLRNHPFGGRRVTVGGEQVSLDDIEHGSLIPNFGYRAHAVLGCVARSCPPLRGEAYLPDKLDAQADDNFRIWLQREDLNRFLPEQNRVEISSVFEWFRDDFEKAGGLRSVLARYAPDESKDFLSGDDYEIEFLPYDWALNDQQATEFSRVRLVWNWALDFIR